MAAGTKEVYRSDSPNPLFPKSDPDGIPPSGFDMGNRGGYQVASIYRCSTYLTRPIFPIIVSRTSSVLPCPSTTRHRPYPALPYDPCPLPVLSLLGRTVIAPNQTQMPRADQRSRKTGVYLTDLTACDTYTTSDLPRRVARKDDG